MNLFEEFRNIKANHKNALMQRGARVCLGSSVIRVFAKDSKQKIASVLTEICLDELNDIESQEMFRQWFEKELSKLLKQLRRQTIIIKESTQAISGVMQPKFFVCFCDTWFYKGNFSLREWQKDWCIFYITQLIVSSWIH